MSPRRQYTEEFKAEAVRLAEMGDVPKAKIARDLGICETVLYRWIQQRGTGQAGSASMLSCDEKAELARLRRDVKRLEMERDILKKAAAYFAQDQL